MGKELSAVEVQAQADRLAIHVMGWHAAGGDLGYYWEDEAGHDQADRLDGDGDIDWNPRVKPSDWYYLALKVRETCRVDLSLAPLGRNIADRAKVTPWGESIELPGGGYCAEGSNILSAFCDAVDWMLTLKSL